MLTAINKHIGAVVAIETEEAMRLVMKAKEAESAFGNLKHHWLRETADGDVPKLQSYLTKGNETI